MVATMSSGAVGIVFGSALAPQERPSLRNDVAPMLPIVAAVVFEVASVAKHEEAVRAVLNAVLDLVGHGPLARRAEARVRGRANAMGSPVRHSPIFYDSMGVDPLALARQYALGRILDAWPLARPRPNLAS